MFALRYSAVLILVAAAALGYFVWHTTGLHGRFDFAYGLDLSGGSELTYNADISKIPASQVPDSLATLQQVIERRVNAFGVSEPSIQTAQGGALGTGQYRLIVDLPGVTDINQAIALIGQTPTLEFKLVSRASRPRPPTPTVRSI